MSITGGLQNQILFSDEKLFVVEQQINKQNDRILATNKESLPPSPFHVSRTQKPVSVMVWVGVTSDGRTPLVFIPQGVKINQSIYRESILESVLKLGPKTFRKSAMDLSAGLSTSSQSQGYPRMVQAELSCIYFFG